MRSLSSRQSLDHPPAAGQWLEKTIIRLVTEAPENKLQDFNDMAIFDQPIIGIADGDDPIFGVFRKAVSPRHLQPRQVLQKHSPAGTNLEAVRLVNWVLPFSREVRLSNRGGEWPSELYSVARNNGGAMVRELSRRLCRAIENQGFATVSPGLLEDYDAFRSAEFSFSSTWSERHVAYAAGLGRFSLNGCLMTPLGTSVRLGSVVTHMPLPLTSTKRECYQAPCLESGGEGCGVCRERCPVQAITREGLDKAKCYARRKAIREKFLDLYQRRYRMLSAPIVKSGQKEFGYSLGCGLCLNGVPCEAAPFPPEERAR